MERGLLCHTIGLATDGACTVGAMAFPVLGAIGLIWLAFQGCVREHLERGDGAPTEVLVRCEDTRVRHVNVDSAAHAWRCVVSVQSLTVVDAIETPGGWVGLVQLPVQLQELSAGPLRLLAVLSVNLGDCTPGRVCLQNGWCWPRMGVDLLLGILPCAVHHEDAEAVLVGVSMETRRRARGHVLHQLLEILVGASTWDSDDPPELLLVHDHGIAVDDDLRAIVGQGPGATDLYEILFPSLELCLRPLGDRARLQHGGRGHRTAGVSSRAAALSRLAFGRCSRRDCPSEEAQNKRTPHRHCLHQARGEASRRL
mmetsp:Transcript_24977/g.71670  ORF Transcript_24977/g.71670 Transcript_24977/m.71670 type:complete len:312 (-) Transcript_24977:67-1002(-)